MKYKKGSSIAHTRAICSYYLIFLSSQYFLISSFVEAGSGTYPSSDAILSPFLYAQSKNAVTCLFLSPFS